MDFQTELDQMTRTWSRPDEKQKKQERLQLTTQMDYAAFRSFFFYTNKQNVIPWINWGLGFVAGPVYAFAFAVRYIYLGLPLPWQFWALLPVVGIFCAYLALEPRIAFQRHNRFENKWDRVRYTYTFSDDALQCAREGALTPGDVLPYTGVLGAVETLAAFYLHAADEVCWVLPKKGLALEQTVALRALFGEKLGEKFKKMK